MCHRVLYFGEFAVLVVFALNNNEKLRLARQTQKFDSLSTISMQTNDSSQQSEARLARLKH